MRPLRLFLLAICLGVLAFPLAQAQEKPGIKPLTLGLMPYLTTRALLGLYQPVASRLEQELKQPVQLVTAPDFDTFVKRVIDGEYDLVLLAPHYARLAIRDYGYSPILIHKAPIRGVLVTARNQPLTDLAELRGQTIAVVDRSAVMAINGALLLAEAGLKENSDYQFVESVSHSSALHGALAGKSRAAIISHSTLMLAAPELQRDAVIFRELPPIPGMFYIANKHLASTRQAEVKQALHAFERSSEGQAFFEKTSHVGFREPTREDAQLLDRMLPETRRQLGSLLH